MSLDEYLKGKGAEVARPGRKCSICGNPPLKDEVDQYAAGVQDGTILHSQHHIWLHYFAPTWGIKSQNTLRNHIRICLGISL
tara:strand:+ start:20872 stop:21117 length:246 start_codon:yes stop_codon:yes gene_type:complete